MKNLEYDRTGLGREAMGADAEGVVSIERSACEALLPRLNAARLALGDRFRKGELGFIGCPDQDVKQLQEWARKKRAQGFTDQVIIGIGGSNLGTRAILDAARAADYGGMRAHFAENIDPTTIHRLFDSLDLEKTLFLVITKSGTTLETMGIFWIAYDRVVKLVGADQASRHFVAITDPKVGSLRPLAESMGFESFDVPPNVGGRFSVFTNVGLVPLALAGYPLVELLEGARQVRDSALHEDSLEKNVAMQLAADHYLLWSGGISQVVMMSYSDQLLSMVDWFRQLWAESLGKAENRQGVQVHVGQTPVKAWGVVDQHSQVQLYMEGPRDKHILFVEVEQFEVDLRIPAEPELPESVRHLAGRTLSEVLNAELAGTRAALSQSGRPISRLVFRQLEPGAVGSFIFCWEFVTALMGELMDIDAFDQPGVELGKKIAHGLLGRKGFESYAAIATSPKS